MEFDIFKKRKKDVLKKPDKSNIGRWDEKIIPLCEKINENENFYTTSSCSGRIVLLIEKDRKAPNLFVFVSHDLVYFDKFFSVLKNSREKNLIFKQEPCGLHVACRTLEEAQNFLNKARKTGWKKAGIISSGKRYVVEMFGTNKLEFPIVKDGKILVDESFLKVVLDKANSNLKKSWIQIESFKKII